MQSSQALAAIQRVNREAQRLAGFDKERVKKQSSNVASSRRALLHFLLLVAGIVVCSIVARVMLLRTKYKLEFLWYDGGKLGSPDQGRYGRQRGVAGEGSTRFSMTCVAIAQTYPFLYRATNLFMLCPALNNVQAMFLMTFVQVYHSQLTDVLWSGSSEQLRLNQLPSFLGSYDQWSSAGNQWSFLFESSAAFQSAGAVREAYTLMQAVKKDKGSKGESVTQSDYVEGLKGSYLYSLFYGGACHFIVEQYNPDLQVTDYFLRLVGSEPVYYVDCASEALYAGGSAAITAAGYTAGAIGGLRQGGLFLAHKAVESEFEKQAASKGYQVAEKNLAGKIGQGVGKLSASVVRKIQPQQLEEAGSKVLQQSQGMLRTSSVRTAFSATEDVEADAAEAAEAATSAGEVAEVGAIEASAEAVGEAVGAVSGGICGPAAFLCGFVFANVLGAVLTTVAVAVAAGLAAGASHQCATGNYYTLETTPDGRVVMKKVTVNSTSS